MNLILHQFLKEFRYLRLRWCFLLFVLVLNLLIQLEWLLPMDLNSKSLILTNLSFLTSAVQWMIVWWFGLSVATEDDASGGRSFLLARPISRLTYWGGRVSVWVILVVLPMMLQSGIFLVASGRPFAAIVQGMGHRAWVGGSMLLWVLSASLLFRGWQRYALIVLFTIGSDGWFTNITARIARALHLEQHGTPVIYADDTTILAVWLAGPLLAALAFWHVRRSLSLMSRSAGFVVIVLFWQLLAGSSLLTSDDGKDLPPDLAANAGTMRDITLAPSQLRCRIQEDESRVRHLQLDARQNVEAMPANTIAAWRTTSLVATQGNAVLPALKGAAGRSSSSSSLMGLSFFYPMAGLLDDSSSGMLTARANDANLRVPMTLPKDRQTPLDVDMTLDADWMRLRKVGELPIRSRAKFVSPGFEFEILGIAGDGDGPLRLDYRMSIAASNMSDYVNGKPQLYVASPGKRLLWQMVVHNGAVDQFRGDGLGELHLMERVKIHGVLAPGSGITIANLHEQRLVFGKPEYLGTSQHHASIKGLKVAEKLTDSKPAWPSTDALSEGNPHDAFLDQINRLPKPAPTAPRDEIARYVASAFATHHTFASRNVSLDEGPKWPGSHDREIATKLAFVMMQEPGVFAVLKSKGVRGSDFANLVLAAGLLEAKIPGVSLKPEFSAAVYRAPNAAPNGELSLSCDDATVDACIQSLLTRSDEPLRVLKNPAAITNQERLKRFADSPEVSTLRHFARTQASAEFEEARRLTMEKFKTLAPMISTNAEYTHVLTAAASLGVKEALDWLLRIVAVQSDDYLDDETISALVIASRVFPESSAEGSGNKALRQLVRDCRRWTVTDLRYDAANLRWELITR